VRHGARMPHNAAMGPICRMRSAIRRKRLPVRVILKSRRWRDYAAGCLALALAARLLQAVRTNISSAPDRSLGSVRSVLCVKARNGGRPDWSTETGVPSQLRSPTLSALRCHRAGGFRGCRTMSSPNTAMLCSSDNRAQTCRSGGSPISGRDADRCGTVSAARIAATCCWSRRWHIFVSWSAPLS